MNVSLKSIFVPSVFWLSESFETASAEVTANWLLDLGALLLLTPAEVPFTLLSSAISGKLPGCGEFVGLMLSALPRRIIVGFGFGVGDIGKPMLPSLPRRLADGFGNGAGGVDDFCEPLRAGGVPPPGEEVEVVEDTGFRTGTGKTKRWSDTGAECRTVADNDAADSSPTRF